MSLLGVDVGTTGCKATVFTEDGVVLGSGYIEYPSSTHAGSRTELDPLKALASVKKVIRRATSQMGSESPGDTVSALCITSMGEAFVPVTESREVLGTSFLGADPRGEEYIESLSTRIPGERLHAINGNFWANQYSVTKLMWIRDHLQDLYDKTDQFLLWSGFVSFMLGAEPAVDFSLANRTLLFDLVTEKWSDELVSEAGLDPAKLPRVVPPGTPIGTVATTVSDEIGVPAGTPIVAGAHDQCANALGCGAIKPGDAMFGLGTYLAIVPILADRSRSTDLYNLGLNLEHAAVPGSFVSLIYNMSGAIVRWYRDSFAAAEHHAALAAGTDVYEALFAELPHGPSRLTVLPHFSAMGPPDYIDDASGAIVGLTLDTPRGEILAAILEGAAYSFRGCVDSLSNLGMDIDKYRVVGGGSRSDGWVQIYADIFGRPFIRPAVTEAGTLGAALLAGIATGAFTTVEEAVESAVRTETEFIPNPDRRKTYDRSYQRYRAVWNQMENLLRGRQ